MKDNFTRPDSINFPKPSYDDWKHIAIDSLKGKPFDKVMYAETYEDFKVNPLYTSDDTSDLGSLLSEIPGEFPFNRSNDLNGYKENSWEVCQKFNLFPIDKFNSDVKKAISEAEISLIIDINEFKSEDIEKAFSGLDLSNTNIYFEPQFRPEPILDALNSIEVKSFASVNIEFDPYNQLITKGNTHEDMNRTWARCSEHLLRTDSKGSASITVNAKPINRAGSNITQELAYAVSMGCEILSEMSSRGHDINTIAKSIRFHFAIGSNFFFELAKFIAARILWAKIVTEYGGDEEASKMNLFASSGKNNKSSLDIHTNILRSTGEAVAAVLGGINSLYIEPFDMLKGDSTVLSQRIARNTQLVIKEETHLVDTVDPVAGSWYVDSITKSLSEAAWKLFQSVEVEGGMIESLKNGTPQSNINKIAERRTANFTQRKDTLIGVNIYANLIDKDFERIEIESNDNDTFIKPLRELNLPHLFENIRVRSENHKNENGTLPEMYILQYGKLSDYKGRSDFTIEFFSTGGFETVLSPAFDTYVDAAKWVFEHNIDRFVICSSDELYKEFVPQLAELVKKLKPLTKIILAGDPKVNAELNTRPFIDEFIHIRSNIYETLNNIQLELGIK